MRGQFADAVAFSEQAADIARANGNLTVASVNLALAAWYSSTGDTSGAVPLAVEALALARQSDMPYAITNGLQVLGIALADTDPDEARACLSESVERSATLGYENAHNLALALVLVSRLDNAPATLEIAKRTIRQLHWARQPVWLTAGLNLVAHALAPTAPDAAAVIQGAARAVALRALETPRGQSNPTPVGRNPRTTGGYFGEVRRETTRLLAAELGDERLGQLRAEGNAMDDDHAVAYTLDQIAKTLTNPDHPA
jgi:hypothetical protein